MELEEHGRRLIATNASLQESIAEHRAIIKDHAYNAFHPDVLKSISRQVGALGRTALELIKLAPHIPEIRQQYKDREQV